MEEIIAASIPRTGSVLIYNILRALHEQVIKTHNFEKYFQHPGPFVITYRDPLDVFCSFWRIDVETAISIGRRQEFDYTINERNALRLADKVVFEFIRLSIFLHTQIILNNNHNMLFLKYEEFWDDHNIIYDKLADFFKVEIPLETRHIISKNFSIKKAVKTQQKYKDFNEWDPISFIHGFHVGPAKPGKWWAENKNKMTQDAVNYIKKRLCMYRRMYGYEKISGEEFIQDLLNQNHNRMQIIKTQHETKGLVLD